MTANITFNPYLTSNAGGSFNVQSDGFIQGQAMDDPSARYRLAGGVLSNDETIPMWGGVGIFELVPGAVPGGTRGGTVGRALTLVDQADGQMTGFSVFDQAYGMINTPQSPVPQAGSGSQVNFYRFGSNARIAVAVDPALINLQGELITTRVSWDFVNQKLVKGVAAYDDIAITSQTRSGQTVTVVTSAAHPFAVGDQVNLSGAVADAYNGTKTLLTVADNTHFTYAIVGSPASPAGTPGQVDAGGGYLPVDVLAVQVGNSMTVDYDDDTGFATWNRSGSCALLLLR